MSANMWGELVPAQTPADELDRLFRDPDQLQAALRDPVVRGIVAIIAKPERPRHAVPGWL